MLTTTAVIRASALHIEHALLLLFFFCSSIDAT
jgi:hypothetical protein